MVGFKGSSVADYWKQMTRRGSEVKFRKYTITALFRVTRHGLLGILCLCLQGDFNHSSLGVYVRETV